MGVPSCHYYINLGREEKMGWCSLPISGWERVWGVLAESGIVDELGDDGFPEESGDVDAGESFEVFELGDGLQGELVAFVGWVLGVDDAFVDWVWDVGPGDVVFHAVRHLGGFQGGDAGEDAGFRVESLRVDGVEPLGEAVEVVDALGLEEDGAGIDLVFEADELKVEGVGERIRGGA